MRTHVLMALWVAAVAAVAFAGAPAAAQEDDEGGDQPWEQENKPEKKQDKKLEKKGKGKAAKPAADEGPGDGAKKDDDAPLEKDKDGEKDKAKPAGDEKKGEKKKGKGAQKDSDAAPPPQGFKGQVVEETQDYIRCKDDVHTKFLAAREEYSSLKRSQTNLLSLINRDRKVLDQIKGLAEDEIEPDVRAQQIQALTKSIDDAQEKLRKLEPKLQEKRIKYEPLRSKCED